MDKHVAEKIMSLIDEASLKFNNASNKANKVLDEAEELAREVDYELGLLRIVNLKTRYLSDQFDFYGYEENLKRTLDIANFEGNFAVSVETSIYMGTLYSYIHDELKSLDYYMKALEMIEREKVSIKSRPAIFNKMGLVYQTLSDVEKASDYFEKSYEASISFGNKIEANAALTNLAGVLIFEKEYDEVETLLLKSEFLAKEAKDNFGMARILTAYGNLHTALMSYEKANDYYGESEEKYKVVGEPANKINLYMDWANSLSEEGRHSEAVEKIQSFTADDAQRNYFYRENEIMGMLSTFHYKMGDYKSAYDYLDKQRALRKQNSEKQQRIMNNRVYLEHEKLKSEMKVRKLEEINKNMDTIAKIAAAITSTLNQDQIVDVFFRDIRKVMQADLFGFAIFEEEMGALSYQYISGKSGKSLEYDVDISDQRDYGCWAGRSFEDIVIFDVLDKDETEIYGITRKDLPYISQSVMRSELHSPIMYENSLLGVISAKSINKEAFGRYDLEVFKALASFLSIALNNSQKSDELRRLNNELTLLNKELKEISRVDGLTKLLNRYSLNEDAPKLFEQVKCNGENLSVLMMDVDHFKEYNDTYGHLRGDECLISIGGAILRKILGVRAYVYRYGGDEFIVLMPGLPVSEAEKVGFAIKDEVEIQKIPNKKSKVSDYVTVTIGVASLDSENMGHYHDVFALADEAMYKAKQKGKNNVEVIQ